MIEDLTVDKPWLMLGDCLERMKEIPDGSVDLVLCDPPYGTTACKWDSIIDLDLMWSEINRILKKGKAAVFTSAQPFTTSLINSNINNFKYSWVWKKNRATNFPNAKRRPLTSHEDIPIFINGKLFYNPQKTKGHPPTNSAKGASQGTIYHGDNVRNYAGGNTERFPLTVLEFKCERGLHPTQKPVELGEYFIKTYTEIGDVVLDFCKGSGTFGVSAKNTKRRFIGIEKDPQYFEVGKNRISNA